MAVVREYVHTNGVRVIIRDDDYAGISPEREKELRETSRAIIRQIAYNNALREMRQQEAQM